MLSMAVPSRLSSFCLYSCSFPRQTSCSRTPKSPILVNPKFNLVDSSIVVGRKFIPISRNLRLVPFAAPEALTAEASAEDATSPSEDEQEPEKVVVEKVANPRLVLKFIWMEKNIGLALDQVIPGHGTVPLSPYYFWPRKDAWEELKATLESKPWISQKKMIILLNQATDIINLWQQSGGNITA